MNCRRSNCSQLVLAMGLLLSTSLCAVGKDASDRVNNEGTTVVASRTAIVLISTSNTPAADQQSAAPPKDAAPDASENTEQKYAELVQKAQDRIEMDPALSGVVVWGLRELSDAEGKGQVVRLEGKLNDKQQGLRVEQIVTELMKSDRYWWKGEGNLAVTSEGMVVGEGSEQLANRLYALGLESFWAGKYEDADRAFARAAAESPKDDYLRYWRAVTALALDNEERAEQKLAPLLRKYPLGSRTPAIAVAFERLQGPIRRHLQALEDRLLEKLKI